ncbi:MAG: GNAT family N-acetyltransferase, partial [Acidobacteria bacterium]|nr:GNAT family N-acetyltransferase [Acidobacteriota bacterium]
FQRGSCTFVAQEEEKVVGFIVVRKERDAGHVITIDVEPAYQDRGVGTQLMEAGEEWLRAESVREIYLETAEDNHKAIAFFRRWGYETVRRISGYYADGKDAFLMRKELESGRRERMEN